MFNDLNKYIPLVATFTVASLRLVPIANSFLANIITTRANKNSIDRLYKVREIFIDSRWNKSEAKVLENNDETFNNVKITFEKKRKDPDQRDYFVSNKKIEKKGFYLIYSIVNGIEELLIFFKNNKNRIHNNY